MTDVALFRDAYAPLLRSHPLLPSPARRAADDERSPRVRSTTRWRRSRTFSQGHGATTAALIVEPLVQGAGGMAMYDARYLGAAREMTQPASTCT